MKKVYAICIRTYPDEDDMIDYAEGKKKLHQVRIYHEGKRYLVGEDFDKKYYTLSRNLK